MSQQFDVVVVGFGPGGEVLASTLGRAGHRVLVVEKAPTLYGLPRMTTLDGELARVLTNVCDGDTALANAIPLNEFRMVGADGEPNPSIDWSGTRGGFPAHMAMHQPDIEAALETRIGEYAHVDVRWNTSCFGFAQDVDGVDVTIAPTGSPEDTQVVRARYLVGMDGSSSFVRRTLGIDTEILFTHEDWWILTDFDVVKPLPPGFDEAIGTMDPERPRFFGLAGRNRCRTDVKVMPGEDVDQMRTEEQALEWIEEHHGISRDHLSMTRQVAYKFRSQMAGSFRVGRVFIGGDAAHSMTPFMGQGACCSMRDAINLGWKLATVLDGASAPSLLDSYETERAPHAAYFVHGSLGVWKALEEPDPTKAAARDAAMRSGQVPPPPPWPSIVSGAIRPPERGDQTAGALAPQGRVSADGRDGMLDEVVEPVFALVATTPLAGVLDTDQLDFLRSIRCSIVEVGTSTQSSLTDLDGVYDAYARAHGVVAFLTRPDFYQYGSARTVEEIGQLVDDLRTTLGGTDRSSSPADLASAAS